MTSLTGLVLLVVLAVEGFTILSVQQMIKLHIVLGLFLIGPVLWKSDTTGYRFIRYYGHHEAYVRKGPPHIVLRVLGPLVILSSLAVLGTGVGLIFDGHQHGHRPTIARDEHGLRAAGFQVVVELSCDLLG